jgi:hypothetical protein
VSREDKHIRRGGDKTKCPERDGVQDEDGSVNCRNGIFADDAVDQIAGIFVSGG